MNCPSRTDEDSEHDGWNQNPSSLSPESTTRQDLNGTVNARQRPISDTIQDEKETNSSSRLAMEEETNPNEAPAWSGDINDRKVALECQLHAETPRREPLQTRGGLTVLEKRLRRVGQIILKFSKFIGPGFMVSVAYIDPGNYATDVAAGAKTQFKLLFIVLMSNLFAICLQSLAIRLGTVTGLDLAEHCRAHLAPWLNITLYIFAEAAIIATDMAEVIGSAIALNLLFKIPLVAGCALTLVDVLIILLFYSPNGSIRRLRYFEFFVIALVLGVVICFIIQLSLIQDTSVGEVFKGFLPSSTIVEGSGIYLSCGILGATVMPHSLYLGSGMVHARLKEFDKIRGSVVSPGEELVDGEKSHYRPSLAAIKECLKYSTWELALTLCIFALFVNSAILIMAGSSLSSNPDAASADLFGIHDLLSKSLAPVAGTIFALALLLSGTSAGIICTIAGQMVSEGALNWTLAPWLRRLITRSISITPSIIIAGAVGRNGLSAALNGSQVALSVILPVVSAPLIYFTARSQYMTVRNDTRRAEDAGSPQNSSMRNHVAVTILAITIWLVITIMNIALLVLLGLGKA